MAYSGAIVPSKKPFEVDKETRVIGHNLATLRKERGLTQVELAAQLGVPQSLLSQYERGVLRLHGRLIVELCRLLSASADELLGIKTATSDRLQVQRRFLRKLQDVDGLSKRDQAALLRTIEAFLDGRLKKSA